MMYNKQKGDNYEVYVLNTILKNEFSMGWLCKDIPIDILIKTNLNMNPNIINYKNCDIGFDILGIKDNEYYFIQCKNYNKTICINDLCSFYFLLNEYNLNGIVYYNGKLSKRLYDLKNNKVEYKYLEINNLIMDLNLNMKLDMDFENREYQQDAYKKLNNLNRAILSIPCGMGKSYIGYLLSKNYKNIILITPTRVLTEELLNRFYNYYKTEYNPILLSMDGELDITKIKLEEYNIIATTYKSINILKELVINLKDIYYIFDEYHNLSIKNLEDETDDINKILLNKDNNILFMSATPIKHKYFENIIVYNYKWQDAIYNNYICDFKITIPNKIELPEQIINEFIDLFKNNNLNKEITIQIYFLLKNIIINKNKRTIIYVSVCDLIEKYKTVIKYLSIFFGITININDICYYTSKTKRHLILNSFREGGNINDYNILLNVSILNEGIDIKECDSIFISYLTENMINTVQRMSRCNRIMKNKSKCNIYLWCDDKNINKIYDHLEMDNMDFVKRRLNIYDINNDNIYINKEIKNIKYIDIIKDLNDNVYNDFILLFNKEEKVKSNDYIINHEQLQLLLKYKDRKMFMNNIINRNSFIENKDYIITYPNIKKNGGNNKKIIYLTINSALILSCKTRRTDIYKYFIELNKYLLSIQHLLD
jgi:superfamily II DNA or RNA helicase/phage anti-repressor protein